MRVEDTWTISGDGSKNPETLQATVEIPEKPGTLHHMANWLDCIRRRAHDDLYAPVEAGYGSLGRLHHVGGFLLKRAENGVRSETKRDQRGMRPGGGCEGMERRRFTNILGTGILGAKILDAGRAATPGQARMAKPIKACVITHRQGAHFEPLLRRPGRSRGSRRGHAIRPRR